MHGVKAPRGSGKFSSMAYMGGPQEGLYMTVNSKAR